MCITVWENDADAESKLNPKFEAKLIIHVKVENKMASDFTVLETSFIFHFLTEHTQTHRCGRYTVSLLSFAINNGPEVCAQCVECVENYRSLQKLTAQQH